MRSLDGVRAVAVFEAAKGCLVIVAGFGLLSLVHHDVQHIADQIVRHLHLNPASRYPEIFSNALAGLTQPRVKLLAIGAAAYALVRFIEAYGLWRRRRWAEWFAAISGAIYIPFELYEMHDHARWLAIGAFSANVAIVWLMCRALLRPRRDEAKRTV